MISMNVKVLMLWMGLVLLAGQTASSASESAVPTDLAYTIIIEYDDGRMHQKSLDLIQGEAGLDDGESICEKLAVDRIISKYSDTAKTSICRYPNTAYREEIDELSVCEEKRSYSKTNEYYGEVQNSSGGYLESFSFEFKIPTKCFKCLDGESENGREYCQAENIFDFALTIPYHEDASALKIFEIKNDGEKTKVFSIGVSKFKDAPKEYENDEAAIF
jgi:hypothetical protein